MKKILALTLALILCLSLAACGGDTAKKEDGKENGGTAYVEKTSVEKYIEEHEDELLEGFNSSFTSSGLTCKSTIKADGYRMLIDVNINELKDVDDATKTAMQETYDGMQSTFDESLADMQKDIPELTGYTLYVRDVDGNLLATVKAGK